MSEPVVPVEVEGEIRCRACGSVDTVVEGAIVKMAVAPPAAPANDNAGADHYRYLGRLEAFAMFAAACENVEPEGVCESCSGTTIAVAMAVFGKMLGVQK